MEDSFLERRLRLKGATKCRELFRIQSIRWQFLERAQANAIGLAQGSIHGPGFSHTHLGVVEDQGRDIPRMGIAVANEATALGGLVDDSLKNPKVLFGATEYDYRLHLDASAAALFS
jgi:hypothetical protein